MARVKTCCCGCSLRTGSLIILWLNVVCGGFLFFSRVRNADFSFLSTALVALPMTVAAMGVYGINEKKPKFLLPYIYLNVFCIVIGALSLVLLVVASSFVMQALGGATKSLHQSATFVDFNNRNNYHSFDATGTVGVAGEIATGIIYIVALLILVNLAILYYFTEIVYGHYKQMVEGRDFTGGMIYSAPVDQGMMGGGAGGYLQPQPVYPPAYGQQPGGVYPPLTEVKTG